MAITFSFSTEVERAAKAFSEVNHVADNSNKAVPSTKNLRVSVDGTDMVLAATNLETAVTVHVPGQVEVDGAFTMPAKLISAFVAALPRKGVVSFEGHDDGILYVSRGANNAHFYTGLASDFPDIPQVAEGHQVDLPGKAFGLGIDRTVFASADPKDEDAREILTGSHLVIGEEGYTMAGADGFRLAVSYGDFPEGTEVPQGIPEMVIPTAVMKEVSRSIGNRTSKDNDASVALMVNDSHVAFRIAGDLPVEVVGRRITSSNFPNWAPMLRPESSTVVAMDVADVQQALRTCGLLASEEESPIIRLHMAEADNGEDAPNGLVRMTALADRVGGNTDEIQATMEGEPNSFAVNANYLKQSVAALKDEKQMIFEVNDPESPCIIRVDAANYEQCIMPMFVKDETEEGSTDTNGGDGGDDNDPNDGAGDDNDGAGDENDPNDGAGDDNDGAGDENEGDDEGAGNDDEDDIPAEGTGEEEGAQLATV